MTTATATAQPAAAAPVRGDFPDWMPPMLVKELRQGLRTKGFVGLFVAFHLIAVLSFWWTIEMNSSSGYRGTFEWLNGIFWTFLNVVLLLVIPLRGLGGLRAEMDSRTLDLLVLTRLSSWRIVMGKWVALVAQAALFLIALLPYGVTRYFFGSVDLVQDLQTVGWILVFSAMLTACALWVSAMPRFFRIVMPILLFLLVQGVGLASVIEMAFGSGRGVRRHPFMHFEWVQLVVLASLVLAFLGLAVRRLAPPSENHAVTARVFALVLVAAAMGAALAFGALLASGAIVFAVVVVLIIGAIELCRDCRPMFAHWRPFADRGLGWVGRIFLPGWPSAALFVALAFAAIALPAQFLAGWRPPGVSGFEFAWVLVLAWQMLVFPAVLLSFLPAGSSMRMAGTGYFVLQGLFGTLSLISISNSVAFIAGETLASAFETVMHILPVSSFWHSEEMMRKSDFPGGAFAAQVLVLAVLGVLMWRQSREYWAQVYLFRERRPAEPPAS